MNAANTKMAMPYVQIEDKHGAIASIYYKDDGIHEVLYNDNTGTHFYTEKFAKMSIELVEQSVMSWAQGKRNFI